MSTLIKNGTVVTATDSYKGDVLIEDEKVVAVGSKLDATAAATIDATDKYAATGSGAPRYTSAAHM